MDGRVKLRCVSEIRSEGVDLNYLARNTDLRREHGNEASGSTKCREYNLLRPIKDRVSGYDYCWWLRYNNG